MGIFDFLKKQNLLQKEKNPEYWQAGYEDRKLDVSPITKFPCKFKVDGQNYNIDCIDDVRRFPITNVVFTINHQTYHFSDYFEMCSEEYRRNGYFELADELIIKAYKMKKQYMPESISKQQAEYPVYHFSQEQEEHYAEYQRKIKERIMQVKTFILDDMFQFQDLPFLWNKDLFYSRDKAYMQLYAENADSALTYITEVNSIILDTLSAIGLPMCTKIKLEDIDFDYPIPLYPDSPPNTYLECNPYTPTGKISKYPAILNFATSHLEIAGNYKYQSHPIIGEIKILEDGQIGAASVRFMENGTKFSISRFGLSLVVKRIDSDMGCIFKFEDLKN